MRDPAAIHTTGLGFTLQDAVADHATLADFPTPGVVGRLARAVDSGIVYRDNASAWQVWVTPSGGGGSGFPITFDDGTYTYELIETGPSGGQQGRVILHAWKNATPTAITKVQVDAFTGDVDIVSVNDLNVGPGRDGEINVGRDLTLLGRRHSLLRAVTGDLEVSSDGDMTIGSTSGDVDIDASGNIVMGSLPTSDPGVSGALWSNGGIVQVSP